MMMWNRLLCVARRVSQKQINLFTISQTVQVSPQTKYAHIVGDLIKASAKGVGLLDVKNAYIGPSGSGNLTVAYILNKYGMDVIKLIGLNNILLVVVTAQGFWADLWYEQLYTNGTVQRM
ncbi:hypothetical protein K493DRAFT_303084 [Basidiobolus meristosporus CBS 931.73]|uniref:Uncharacterized protein n=1 Tax=Basidiobolus meristosporus CBS 931.73 TaxID=1314790 RepID=A0A1Y1Y4A6_9FUNG|nr:hypothetical protein K493DRAFT_303084 [Basidiobolus meristosporus CBS 931.73]|eukprot:ORX92818.1 hypothetical protein K493DRAFT_303084 [Basidiobolus meristosporus CBS 931.73]